MKQDIQEEVEIPQGITVKIEDEACVVKGLKGEVQRKLHNPKIKITASEDSVVFEAVKATQREKRMIKSYAAHIKSMIKGIQNAHHYKLKICSGHFPMTVTVKGDVFEIKNFVGETIPRTLTLKEGVNVKVDGHYVLVESVDKELAGQTAALIEKLTRRPAFDKRIFQDGIFIVEKDGKPVL